MLRWKVGFKLGLILNHLDFFCHAGTDLFWEQLARTQGGAAGQGSQGSMQVGSFPCI